MWTRVEAGVEHSERVQVHDARMPEPCRLRLVGGGLVAFVLVEHDAMLAGKRVRPALELVAGGADAVQAQEAVLAPVRILVAMELAAELGDATLEIGRGARKQRLALE